MNVYDFDKTIYSKDSTLQFYFFCMKRKPLLAVCLIRQCFAALFYGIHIYSKTKFKEEFYCFLKQISDIDIWVEDFWKKEYINIMKWYLNQKRETDVIITASPEFLVVPVGKWLGVQMVIASRVDKKSGRYIGTNCYGKEKVERFLEVFPNDEIEAFYSDSVSDLPMAKAAKQAYLVKRGILEVWRM